MQTYRHETGAVYQLGLEKPKHSNQCAAFADSQHVYDRATILQAIKDGRNSLAKFCGPILNQGQNPWCWAFSGSQTMMTLLRQLFDDQTMLAVSMGPAITGVQGGNSIDAMLLEVQSVYGQFPAVLIGEDPTTTRMNIDMRKWPANWKDEAAKRQAVLDSVVRCHSADELASALIAVDNDPNRPCDVGVSWQGGGHALTCLEVGSDDGSSLWFAGPNSWSTLFSSGWGSYAGRPGWWRLTERQMADAFDPNGFGSYCLVAAKDAVAPGPVPSPLPLPPPVVGPPVPVAPSINWMEIIEEILAIFRSIHGREPTKSEVSALVKTHMDA